MNENRGVYSDIVKKLHIKQFFVNIILPVIYNENSKDYQPMAEGFHYLNGFNYFMGLRVTHNRAKMDNTTEEQEYDDNVLLLRTENYSGRSSKKFKDIDTAGFGGINGSTPFEYKAGGGYNNKGGYVHFFPDNFTFEDALALGDVL